MSYSLVLAGQTDGPEQEKALVEHLRAAVEELPGTVNAAELHGEHTGSSNLLNLPPAPPPSPEELWAAAPSGVYVRGEDGELAELTNAQLAERTKTQE